MTIGGYHYQVFRAPTNSQSRICDDLNSRIPEGRGRAFLPMWEYYRRDRKRIDIKLMFTGYVFMWTDLKRSELRDVCTSIARPVRANLEKTADIWNEDQDYIYDLTEDEERFFQSIFDEYGVERMSYGYIDDESGKAVVMEGALRHYSDRIVKLDKRNWLAWVDIKIGKEPVVAGLKIEDKETWFPD